MLPTKEELTELYSSKSNHDLLEIAQKENGFTELAIEVASAELTKRNIQPDDINDYLQDKIDEEAKYYKLSLVELTFGEKMRFFFLWLVSFFNSAYMMNYSEDGLTTKLKQSKVFHWIGFSSFMTTGLLAVIFDHSNLESIIIWIAFFAATYVLEKRIRSRK